MSNFDTPREVGPLPDFAQAPPRRAPLPAQDAAPQAAAAQPAPAQSGQDLLNLWYFDPVQFAWDCFGMRLWKAQRDICAGFVRQAKKLDTTNESGYVAVKSGQKVGKSRLVALIALWWAVTRDNGRVVLLAPTGNQIRTVLWSEITTLYGLAQNRLGHLGGLGGQLNVVPDAGLQFSSENWIIGRATNDPKRMQGASGRNLMYLADEASGIERGILEVARGNIQGGGILGMFGNPNQTTGAFYDAFTSEKELFDRFSISSEDTPNFRKNEMVIPGLALKQTILQNRIAWGGPGGYLDDPRYQVRVLGEFPTHASNAVISLAMIARAHGVWYRFAAKHLGCPELGRSPATWQQIFEGDDGPAKLIRVRQAWESNLVPEPLILGVDPARMGDDSTGIRGRRGYRAFRLEEIRKHDTTEVVDRVMHTVRRLRRPNEIVEVRVDAIGLGVGVFDQLRRHHFTEVRAVAVVSSETANNDEEYANLRSELHFGAAAWLRGEDLDSPGVSQRDGGGFEPHQSFEDELVAAQYGFDGTGRLQVEKKVQIKKRLGRSPDNADAFHLAVFDGYRPGRIIAPDQIRGSLRTTPRANRTRGPR